MAEIFALIVLIFSFLGMLVIFLRKIPVLISLPPEIRSPQGNLFFRLRNRVLKTRPFRSFSLETFLQKILSKIRVLTLKTENKTSHWLQQLRENDRKKKEREGDNYWEDLKNSTNNDNKNQST